MTVDVTSVLPICGLLALTSPFAPYITAFELEIAPADEPSNLLRSSLMTVTPSSILSSAADEVTRTPASSNLHLHYHVKQYLILGYHQLHLRPIRPLLSWVITFPLLDCPSVMSPAGATVVPDTDVVPITILVSDCKISYSEINLCYYLLLILYHLQQFQQLRHPKDLFHP